MGELSPIDRLRVVLQDLIDSQRTIMCSPELESRIKTMVAASPAPGLWKVDVMSGMPDTVLFVLDHHALDAANRQALQTMKWPLLFERDERPLAHRYRDWSHRWWGDSNA